MKQSSRDCDFLVIGSGLAGLVFALKAARSRTVIVCTQSTASECNSRMAQGGIAAVLSETDSFESHTADTLSAGAGLCDPEVVSEIIQKGPGRIHELVEWGISFDRTGENLNLTLEGGHSNRRIVHSKDRTGLAVHTKLLELCRQHPNIELLENRIAIDLMMPPGSKSKSNACAGALFFNSSHSVLEEVRSCATVLSTGGLGQVYLHTTNSDHTTGDGVAMAYRAGAVISNLEFVQFHPTCFYDADRRSFLVSEALRGEGAVLIDHNGTAFMDSLHLRGSLAPRDIVSRGIVQHMAQNNVKSVFLDATNLSEEFLRARFPYIYDQCHRRGLDPSKVPIPVVPAAHYLCGGIKTDVLGRTNIEHLFALGEVACTGLHGANRLASNSLLECLVTAHNLSQYLDQSAKRTKLLVDQQKTFEIPSISSSESALEQLNYSIKRTMWENAGVIRTWASLSSAKQQLAEINGKIETLWRQQRGGAGLIKTRNMALVAQLIASSALSRRESRGCHYVSDFPLSATDHPGLDSTVALNLT